MAQAMGSPIPVGITRPMMQRMLQPMTMPMKQRMKTFMTMRQRLRIRPFLISFSVGTPVMTWTHSAGYLTSPAT